jgi:hypothetical protein
MPWGGRFGVDHCWVHGPLVRSMAFGCSDDCSRVNVGKRDPTVLGGRDAADRLGVMWVGKGANGEVPLDTRLHVVENISSGYRQGEARLDLEGKVTMVGATFEHALKVLRGTDLGKSGLKVWSLVGVRSATVVTYVKTVEEACSQSITAAFWLASSFR